ncbi:MAG TPA: SAV0927 family protein [Bacillus sp. (in: firmicutes)]|nr:SAV0927 family protein [Bacillus sp. (in: firmicutes)]
MNMHIVSEKREQQPIHYYCLITDHYRYDLMIAYSNHFLGKAMVTSLQNGQMVLLCSEDIETEEYWAPKLGIEQQDVGEFQHFFHLILQSQGYVEQYC